MRRQLGLPFLLAAASCTGNEAAVIPGADGGREPAPSVVLPPALVLGDGSAEGAALIELYRPPPGSVSTDLDWNPESPHDLWVTMRRIHEDAPCNEPLGGALEDPVCALLGGSVAILTGADGTGTPAARVVQDPNAWHFMRMPPGLAFGAGSTFATCGEARTGNWDDDVSDFMGPTLWSSDAGIFGVQPKGKNGSHLDMLHATPFCMGIAHERDNVYWTWNGDVGALDRYDFHEPHEVGGEDHSDGEASRWLLGELLRVPGVPSHLVFDAKEGAVYATDTGHGRVVRLDATSGRDDGTMTTDDAQMPFVTRRSGATLDELIPPGTLTAPSGIALSGDTVFVTDNATSRIVAVDRSGTLVASLDTGLPPGALAGIAIGPDGKAYLADLRDGTIRRVEAR